MYRFQQHLKNLSKNSNSGTKKNLETSSRKKESWNNNGTTPTKNNFVGEFGGVNSRINSPKCSNYHESSTRKTTLETKIQDPMAQSRGKKTNYSTNPCYNGNNTITSPLSKT
jgi:hypothetical protein